MAHNQTAARVACILGDEEKGFYPTAGKQVENRRELPDSKVSPS
jgi:hypothetical protein